MMTDWSSTWRVINTSKSEYLTVSLVERTVHGKKEMGYFKFSSRENQKHIGPFVANELVSNRLAQMVGLPVARTELTTLNGRTGIVSMAKSGVKLKQWNQIPLRNQKSLFHRVINPKRLFKTFVFDVWICNIDRSGKNIIVYPVNSGGLYDFYLIDHELALLGAIRYENKPWYSTYWNRVVEYNRGYEPALLPHMKSYKQLAPYVQEIQKISPERIRSVINQVPKRLLSPVDKKLMETLLLHRQRRLHHILTRCIRDLTRMHGT